MISLSLFVLSFLSKRCLVGFLRLVYLYAQVQCNRKNMHIINLLHTVLALFPIVVDMASAKTSALGPSGRQSPCTPRCALSCDSTFRGGSSEMRYVQSWNMNIAFMSPSLSMLSADPISSHVPLQAVWRPEQDEHPSKLWPKVVTVQDTYA